MVRTVEEDWEALSKVMMSPVTQQQMIDRLNTKNTVPTAPIYKWFCCPDMGIIASTTFNVVLVVLADHDGSLTYLPIRATSDHVQGQQLPIICLGHIEDELHWVSVSIPNQFLTCLHMSIF